MRQSENRLYIFQRKEERERKKGRKRETKKKEVRKEKEATTEGGVPGGKRQCLTRKHERDNHHITTSGLFSAIISGVCEWITFFILIISRLELELTMQ